MRSSAIKRQPTIGEELDTPSQVEAFTRQICAKNAPGAEQITTVLRAIPSLAIDQKEKRALLVKTVRQLRTASEHRGIKADNIGQLRDIGRAAGDTAVKVGITKDSDASPFQISIGDITSNITKRGLGALGRQPYIHHVEHAVAGMNGFIDGFRQSLKPHGSSEETDGLSKKTA